MERRELRQDLSEARVQPNGETRSTYNLLHLLVKPRLNSHNLVDQDRAHMS